MKQHLTLLFLLSFALFVSCSQEPEELPPPNILWITSEDNSPMVGAYGDPLATTPNIDRLASQGFLYTRAYANYPVCSPARNTLITGVYASSNGNEQMRSDFPISNTVSPYPELLRAAGYYCTNNVKTDYNYLGNDLELWDESSDTAHYSHRPTGKPFFAVFNFMQSHESSVFRPKPVETLRHDPADVELPPYHPDIPVMRQTWAHYYDNIEVMDSLVGNVLNELEASGEAENTIVFYYGDHGGILPRSKRYVYETGTRVPLVIRIPEKYKDYFPAATTGSEVDRIVSFIDFTPTVLKLAGVEKPAYMNGRAFLGTDLAPGPEYVHMSRARADERIDMSRAVRDKQYRYIRNYMPFRKNMQHLEFLFLSPAAQAWEDFYEAGEGNAMQRAPFEPRPVEELYDTENDPWEVNNLANDPEYREVLERMRTENYRWMAEIRDVGVVPETEYAPRMGDGSMYDYMRSEGNPFDELLAAAEKATFPDADVDAYLEMLASDDAAIRYWGATGMLIHVDEAGSALEELKAMSDEQASSTAVLIAETLYHLGETSVAKEIYVRILTDEQYGLSDRNFALNSIDAIQFRTTDIEEAIMHVYEMQSPKMKGFQRFNMYDGQMSEYLLNQWGVIETEKFQMPSFR